MLIKITGTFLIMASTTIAGLYYANRDLFRVKDLKEMIKALTILISEIEYSLNPLPTAMNNISERIDDPVSKIFSDFCNIVKVNDGKNISQIWEKAINDNKDECYFSKEDIYYLISFGKTLGYLDKGLQVNNISMTLKYIEDKIEQLNKETVKNKKMYQSFGILSGLIICIILI